MSDLRFCPNCGERFGATARFCGGCGQALPASTSFPAEAGSQAPGGAATDAAPGGNRAASTSEQRQPPQQPPQQGLADTGAGPRADASWSPLPGSSLRPNWDQLSGRIDDLRGSFVTGDWAGAARTALIPIGVVFLIAVLVAWSTPLSFGQTVAVGAMLTSLAAGGDLSIHGGVANTAVNGSISIMPLTLTLIGCALLGVLFYRWQRARPRQGLVEFALDVARVWVVSLGGLLVVCLIGRSSFGASDGSVVSSSIWATLFNGTLWLVITAVAVLAWKLPELLPARVHAWRDAVSAPTLGVLVAVAVSALGSIVTLIIVTVATSNSNTLNYTSVSLFLMVAPSVLLMMFAFALGVPLSLSGQATQVFSALPGNAAAGTSFGLLDAADLDARWWLLTLFNIIAVLIGGVVAALRAPTPGQGRRTGWRMGIVLAIVLTAAAVCTGVSHTGEVPLLGASEVGISLDGVAALLLGLAWGALTGWVGALLAPGLPESAITSIRGWNNRDDSPEPHRSRP